MEKIVASYLNRKVFKVGNTWVVGIPSEIWKIWKNKFGEDLHVNIKMLDDYSLVIEPIIEKKEEK